PPFFRSLVPAPGKMARQPANRRDRRSREKDTSPIISLGRLCATVAYYYGLTPEQVAQFSGQQVVMWYETALQEIGLEKNLELEISLVPHTEHPERALEEMRKALINMGRNSHG